ncbi:hypothetical protein D3C77_389830 [compost metagenome]
MVVAKGARLGRVDVVGQDGAEPPAVQVQAQARQPAPGEEFAGREGGGGSGTNRHGGDLNPGKALWRLS